MKRNQIASRVALSAVLLAAVASPVAANAAISPTLTKQYAASLEKAGAGSKPATAGKAAVLSAEAVTAASTSDKAVATMKAIKLADPLELARQYAPETADAWKETLDKYDSAMKKLAKSGASAVQADTVTLKSGEAAALVPAGGGEFQSTKDGVSFTIRTQPAVISPSGTAAFKLEGPESGQTSFAIRGLEDSEPSGKEGKSAVIAVPALQAEKVIADSAGEASPVQVPWSSVTSSSSAESGFFNARIELDKAAESKDAAAIKEALAKLLPLYEKQIEKLESLSAQK
ncbi:MULTISPECIES: hypothetical protein [unclassified Paenibacillus]|uniref:hypothetical protein n=1 Tax=unclassified Paenibacillus TaxID=185978 RepID=UPI00095718BD|nr:MULTISPECIES: hypothetical protein [unclassified Paenibacillus]ASS66583.1 hypothetical protein CIC07_10735 [Paenibacillus sp. RUD330]SIQ01771.1 hypothetical protein SAMN05880555_0330 [Paenibacillus sp. RU4X]SIQ21061.1 hypothetical protein SAMN05880570_0330 [Paenibacillus sp. RU4T]